MPTPITPVTPFEITTTVTGPTDGDLANAASVNNAFTTLQNDVSGFQLLTYGGGLRRRVVASSDTVMDVHPLGAIVVKVAGVWTAIAHTSTTTIDPSALSGGLAASTRYYVYVAIVAGALTFSVSTTAPDAGLRYKTGDEQYQFVSTFFTSGAASLIPYTQDDNVYQYDTYPAVGGGTDANLFLDRGNAGGVVTVPFNASLPSGASSVLIKVAAEAAAGAATSAIGRNLAGGLQNIQAALYPTNGGGLTAFDTFTLTTITLNVDYQNDAVTTRVSMWVAGFTY